MVSSNLGLKILLVLPGSVTPSKVYGIEREIKDATADERRAYDSKNQTLHRHVTSRGSFPSSEALTQLFYPALRSISQKWSMPIRDGKVALTRFTVQFGDRVSVT